MKTFDLYAETGPKRRKTIVHVPALGGCTVRGDTTDEAIANAPAAIAAYLRFLARHGERVDANASTRPRVAEILEGGGFIGAAFLPTDLQPLKMAEAKRLMTWLTWQHEELRRITAGLTPGQLNAKPRAGRSIARILSHVQVEARICAASPARRASSARSRKAAETPTTASTRCSRSSARGCFR